MMFDPVHYIMKKIHLSILTCLALFTACHSQQKETSFEPIAVVELFTSEGCSSCPPADKALSKLTSQAAQDHQKIYTLSFHVDYWNRLGWKDTFSSGKFSERQQQYARILNLTSVYTPQIVVNGTEEFVGSDGSKLNDAVARSLRKKTIASFSKLTSLVNNDKKLSVSYQLNGAFKGSEIHFALVTKQASTSVKRGENVGRVLSHTNIVKQFITTPAAAQGEVFFDLSSVADRSDLLIIAYVQHTDDSEIIAAVSAQP
jgi:hypothetical protein